MSDVHPHDHLHEGEEPPPPGVRAAAFVRWAIIGIVTLIALWSVLYGFGVFSGDFWRGEGHVHAPDAGKEIWTCPMHPSIVSDRPGTCPICNMSLVKVDTTAVDTAVTGTSQVAGLATVSLSAEKVQRGGVTTALVEKRTVSDPIRAVATISADETKLARVQTRFSGWVEKLHVNQLGQRVTKGEVLAEIFSRELYTAQQEYLNAVRWSGGDADTLRKQARQRLELLGIAPEEIAALEKSGQPIRALPIRSPVTGHVVFKSAVEGSFVDPGVELFELADLSQVWAWADVYERDLAALAVGQKAVMSVRAIPGRTFEGRVAFLQPTLDPRTRTLRARVDFPNPGLALKPGMFGEMTLQTKPRDGLVIPREALVDTGEQQYVFVEVAEATYQPRRVVASGANDDWAIVSRGLEPGERVVTSGNFLVDSESRLRQAAVASQASPRTDVPIDREKFPGKYQDWLSCERLHRGMGSMEEDCKNAIPKPWK